MKDVMSYCLMHLDEPVTVEEIAAHFHMDRSVLSRRFRARMKMTLKDYIWKIKEEEASRLLKITDSSIDVIARSVGYEDAAYFGRIFRQKKGETPGVWRRRHRSELSPLREGKN